MYYRKSADGITWGADQLFQDTSGNTSPLMTGNRWFIINHGGILISFYDPGGVGTYNISTSSDGVIANNSSSETDLPNNSYKIMSHGGYLYSIPLNLGESYNGKSVYRSVNGFSWTKLTSNWGVTTSRTIDCISTTDGLLAVFENKSTWISNDGITWNQKTAYTLPANQLKNGYIVPLLMDIFMIGCGASCNTVFKLIANSAPVGVPL